MSERQWDGPSPAETVAALDAPAFRQALASVGVPAAQAAANLREAAQHFNLAGFEAMIAATRPKLWKRMNRQPSRWRRVLRRGAA